MEGLKDAHEYALLGCSLSSNDNSDFSVKCVNKIKRYLINNIGRYAILYKWNGNKMQIPQLVQIKDVYEHVVVAEYDCYDEVGEFRCHLSCCFTPIEIFCGCVKLDIFQDI
jgi:uncharacterized protein Veg